MVIIPVPLEGQPGYPTLANTILHDIWVRYTNDEFVDYRYGDDPWMTYMGLELQKYNAKYVAVDRQHVYLQFDIDAELSHCLLNAD